MEDLEKQCYIEIVARSKNAGILGWHTLQWIDDYADHAQGGILDVYAAVLNLEYLEHKETVALLKFRELSNEEQDDIIAKMNTSIKEKQKIMKALMRI